MPSITASRMQSLVVLCKNVATREPKSSVPHLTSESLSKAPLVDPTVQIAGRLSCGFGWDKWLNRVGAVVERVEPSWLIWKVEWTG